jgi:outer membrane receptor protein involved in Fe transport
MKNNLKLLSSYLLLCSFLFITASLQAGTTGKIAGIVTDKETGEPLVGVNVIIEGHNLGAATDEDGEYYILNIPPGIYTVKAIYIGYNTQVIEEVRVQVDLTTRLDFELSTSILESSEEVVVIAERYIQKDLTSSEISIQADQISALPVRDVSSLLTMQAGITRDSDGALHIRGGRTTEIGYMVDGVQVMNAVNRSAGISIDDQSIEELKAITGTFNAEYGQALSGVVNIVTKKGTDKFTVNATAYMGDHLSFDNDVYYLQGNREWAVAAANALVTKSGFVNYDFSQDGIYTFRQLQEALDQKYKPWQTKEAYLNSYNPLENYDLQLNVSGPLPFTNNIVSYFLAGRYQNRPGYAQGRRYFMPWGLWQPVSDNEHTLEMPDGEQVHLNWYEGISTQAKVFFNLRSLNFSYGFYYNDDYSYGGGQKYLPDGGRNYYTDRFTHIVSATYIFSNSHFLDFKGSYYSNTHKNYLYEDPYDYRYMPTNAGDFQQYVFRPSQSSNIEVKNNPDDFSYWGNDVNRSNDFTGYYAFKIDLTSQIDKYNMVKLGGLARLHDIKRDNYALQFSQTTYRPIIPERITPFHTYYKVKPKEYAAYIQDKIEFEDLIINLGLRFDYFDSDGRVLADPRDPQIYSPFKLDHIYKNYAPGVPEDELVKYTPEEREEFWYKNTEGKYNLSPRFGISFPITAEGVIHFSYGHFFQSPEFQYLYYNPNFWITGAGASNLVGNANLNAERTVMYELGLQQQLFNRLFLQLTGFYRDIRDWIGTGFPIDTYRGLTYYSYVNKDHAVAKGITLSANFALQYFYFNLDYTYQQAKGTSSDVRDAYNDLSAGRAPRVQMIHLDWDQPHSLNVVFGYSNRQTGWTATLITALNSGFPYTPEFARGEVSGASAFVGLRENSERKPTTINLDLRLSKIFKLGHFNIIGYLDITNLLDTRNANYVYADTGLPNYTLQDYQYWSRLTEISNSTEYFNNPGRYSAPRFIQLGLGIIYN